MNSPYFPLEAKKSLGQNFLKNPTIIAKIAQAGEIETGDLIIEIGPGTGELTAGILKEIVKVGSEFDNDSESERERESDSTRSKKPKKGLKTKVPAKIIAIEKDRRAIPILEERFKNEINEGVLEIIEGDFLEMDIVALISGRTFKIIANIPYYITGAIIRKSLELSKKPSKLIFLVQKEVAERIVNRDGKGSILSNSVAFYGKPRLILAVSKGNFVPAPKVDSAVIKISEIEESTKNLDKKTEEMFFAVLHAGFAHKRKILASNLKSYISQNQTVDLVLMQENIEKAYKMANLSPKVRAEELSIDQWRILASEISKR